MFITKKHLSRRTLLRGMGVSVSLPLLNAMIPAATALAQTAAAARPRLGFFYFPHGAVMEKWTPAATGRDFTLGPILEPLAPFQKQLTVVSNLGNRPGESRAVHALVPATWLSCVHPREALEPLHGTDGGPDRRAVHRSGHPLAFAGNSHGPGAGHRQCLRARLWLQLFRDPVVPHGFHAVAGGEQSAPAVPAAVRAGRYRRRAPFPDRAVPQHPRHDCRRSLRAGPATWVRRIATR